jgi:hypothetical protein
MFFDFISILLIGLGLRQRRICAVRASANCGRREADRGLGLALSTKSLWNFNGSWVTLE